MVCAELSLDNCANGFFLLEFIYSWADVPIAETDDVAKLLADRTFSYNPLVFPPKHADNPIFFLIIQRNFLLLPLYPLPQKRPLLLPPRRRRSAHGH